MCVQKNGADDEHLTVLLCVCILKTPVKHRRSLFSGLKVPPFSFKTQSGVFSEPQADTGHHR